MTLSVRRAEIADLEFVGRDSYIPDETRRRKVDLGEVFFRKAL
jgi:hypothetical protein